MARKFIGDETLEISEQPPKSKVAFTICATPILKHFGSIGEPIIAGGLTDEEVKVLGAAAEESEK